MLTHQDEVENFTLALWVFNTFRKLFLLKPRIEIVLAHQAFENILLILIRFCTCVEHVLSADSHGLLVFRVDPSWLWRKNGARRLVLCVCRVSWWSDLYVFLFTFWILFDTQKRHQIFDFTISQSFGCRLISSDIYIWIWRFINQINMLMLLLLRFWWKPKGFG